jgi:DNA-directed RNA polymerase subunit RPC12/RpoP
MAEELRVDAYVCNDCGFKFLGSTNVALNERLAAAKKKRMVLCPKCSGPCRVDKYAGVRVAVGYLVVCAVVGVLVFWLGKHLGWTWRRN